MKRPIALLLAACLAACGSPPAKPPAEPEPAPEPAAPTVAEAPADATPDAQADEPSAAPADAATADASAEPLAEAVAQTAEPALPEPAAPESDPFADLTGWFEGTGHEGVHTLYWQPAGGGKVPRNREFELDVLVLRDGEPVEGLQLQVTGWMPDHSHGLVQMPQAEALGGGRHRVTGLLLHMRGHWQVRFSIIANRSFETVTFELDL